MNVFLRPFIGPIIVPPRDFDVNGAVLRILDANANRAREALRVVEDYARFALDDDVLCGGLKQLRHDFTSATASFVSEAILHRDTPGDVGTGVKTSAELNRDDVAHVVTAAGKRLGEALRTIEEYLKVFDPQRAASLESIRYRFYDVERQIALTLRATSAVFAGVRLYVLITESICKGPWLEVAEAAILGGADCLQLREKDLAGAELLSRARQLVALCRKHGIISIINDRADIAMLSDADGVHIGQSDFPASEVRRLIGATKILGVSTHTLDQAKRAIRDGADYIAVGPFFRSETKPRDFVAGAEYARLVAENLPDVAAVAIAGITPENVDEVLATGIKAVAVSAAVAGSGNPRSAAERLKKKLM